MPGLTERKFCRSRCCGSCKYGYSMFIYDPNEEREYSIRFCFCDGLDMETKYKIEEQLSRNGWRDVEAFPRWFQDIMKMNRADHYVTVADSERYVEDSSCCNMYLPVGPDNAEN